MTYQWVGVSGPRRFLQVVPDMNEAALQKLVGELSYLRHGAEVLARLLAARGHQPGAGGA